MAKVEQRESAWRNPWVWLLIGIMAAAIIINVTFITLAFMNKPGLVVDNFYDKGKSYFYDQAQWAKEQAKLGWDLKLDVPEKPKVKTGETYLIRAKDRNGKPVTGGRAIFSAYRPAEGGQDFEVPLRELGDGIYGASIEFPLKGNWDLIVTVHKGEDKLDIAKRIFVEE